MFTSQSLALPRAAYSVALWWYTEDIVPPAQTGHQTLACWQPTHVVPQSGAMMGELGHLQEIPLKRFFVTGWM